MYFNNVYDSASPTFVILFARLAGVFMAPASTLLLSLAIEFQIFEAKVEQLLRILRSSLSEAFLKSSREALDGKLDRVGLL